MLTILSQQACIKPLTVSIGDCQPTRDQTAHGAVGQRNTVAGRGRSMSKIAQIPMCAWAKLVVSLGAEGVMLFAVSSYR
jgi:hypothetical protein